MTNNFQNNLGKNKKMQLAIVQNNIDLINGCKTCLDPCIHDSKFLPLKYNCFSRDIKDS